MFKSASLAPVSLLITVTEPAAGAEQWASAREAFLGLERLQGVWRGEGEGKWGTSSAVKILAPILDGKVLCRSGRSDYPVQERNPEGEIHQALALIALAAEDSELWLTEYDNEGFVARHRLDMARSSAVDRWVFEFQSGHNLPPAFSARLTLHAPADAELVEHFELDCSGKGHVLYLTNRLSRVSDPPAGAGCPVP